MSKKLEDSFIEYCEFLRKKQPYQKPFTNDISSRLKWEEIGERSKRFSSLYEAGEKDNYYWQFCDFSTYKLHFEKRYNEYKEIFPEGSLKTFAEKELNFLTTKSRSESKNENDKYEYTYYYQSYTPNDSTLSITEIANSNLYDKIEMAFENKLSFLKDVAIKNTLPERYLIWEPKLASVLPKISKLLFDSNCTESKDSFKDVFTHRKKCNWLKDKYTFALLMKELYRLYKPNIYNHAFTASHRFGALETSLYFFHIQEEPIAFPYPKKLLSRYAYEVGNEKGKIYKQGSFARDLTKKALNIITK